MSAKTEIKPDVSIPHDFMPSNALELEACLADPMWRLCSGYLYSIMTKAPSDAEGQETNIVPFKPNRAQRRQLARLWHRNVILKARQLGFTTLVCIMFLDHALFVPNQRCVMVAQDIPKATALFRDKVGFAYDRMPQAIRERKPFTERSKTQIVFENNSSFEITNSARSGTVHRLHISEMGKIGAKFTHKATEIVTGSFPAVPMGSGMIIVESTAEGQSGEFYKIVTRALENEQKGKPLNERDFRLSFFPWHEEPEYVLAQDQRETKEDAEYFEEIEATIGKKLTRQQRNWYIATRDADFSGDEEKMWQEYPSTVEEAFKVSTEGAYYSKQLARARKQKRIGFFPYKEGIPVHTFWDIGAGDGTGIWLMQQIGGEHRFIEYIENWGEAYSYYIGELQKRGYVWGTHHLPHDAEHERQQGDTTEAPVDTLRKSKLGGRWEVVPRVEDINHGIQLTRAAFSNCTFDETGCKEGLIHLQNYRKEWDEARGTWKLKPRHDEHSEGADAYRQYAQGYRPTRIAVPVKKAETNWRTA
jgi:hypothetical protein